MHSDRDAAVLCWSPEVDVPLHASVKRRRRGEISPAKFCREAGWSRHVVSRLKKSKVLEKHTGCVNTVNWNESGTQLLSSGDDTRLCLWSYPDWKNIASIPTAHRENVFCAKFMPTKNECLVSCSGDNQAR
eukprot:Selendium_serpulae@DN6862_c0_g1_i1.p1